MTPLSTLISNLIKIEIDLLDYRTFPEGFTGRKNLEEKRARIMEDIDRWSREAEAGK